MKTLFILGMLGAGIFLTGCDGPRPDGPRRVYVEHGYRDDGYRDNGPVVVDPSVRVRVN